MFEKRTYLTIFHASVAVWNAFVLCYDQIYVDVPFPSKEIEALPLKARHVFLTVWCFVLQIIYFSVSFTNDIYGTDAAFPKNPPFIRRLKDKLFALAFGIAVYVSSVFWILYFIHKDLIFPAEIEALMPPWVNHSMHTAVLPIIFIEMLVSNRNYPSRKAGIILTLLFSIAYTVWILFIFVHTGVWVYPFLDLFNWTMRFMFILLSTGISLCLYILGEKLNSLVTPRKSYANGVNGDMKTH